MIKTPKVHLGDTGLACALLGVDPDALARDCALLGQLPETFAYQELRRQASWHDTEIRLYHFRDKDGTEVGSVLERGARELAGVEVKAAATVTAADFRGLRKLRKTVGQRAGREESVGVLRQPPVTHLHKAEDTLDDPDAVLDPRAHRGLDPVHSPRGERECR